MRSHSSQSSVKLLGSRAMRDIVWVAFSPATENKVQHHLEEARDPNYNLAKIKDLRKLL
jgi:hypothetical protein